MGTGVGDAFACDVGSGAATWLVESEGEVVLVFAGAETRAGEHTEAAADDTHFVGNDVAEHVLGYDDVELIGVAGHLHGGVVDVHVGEFNLGRVLADVFNGGLAPEDRGGEDVRFVDGADFAGAGSGGGDGDFEDAFDFAFFVDHLVCRLDVAVGERLGALWPEVDAAGELAYAYNVDAFGDALGFERGGIGELLIEESGTEVGKKGEVFADGEQGGTFGLLSWRKGLPFWTADGAEEDGVGIFADLDSGVGKGFAFVVDSGAADVGLGVVERNACGLGGGFEDVECDGHYFWSDVVTGENCEFKRLHEGGY